MSRQVMKCPKCKHQESVISSRPGDQPPPCPRCEGVVRMEDITPLPGQGKTAWSTAGSQAKTFDPAQDNPAPAQEDRGMGPEPRGG
jgi:hypothetical protein